MIIDLTPKPGGGGSKEYTAGDGIQIEEDIISIKCGDGVEIDEETGELTAPSRGTEYRPGNGINISGSAISVNTSALPKIGSGQNSFMVAPGGDPVKFLCDDGTWKEVVGGGNSPQSQVTIESSVGTLYCLESDSELNIPYSAVSSESGPLRLQWSVDGKPVARLTNIPQTNIGEEDEYNIRPHVNNGVNTVTLRATDRYGAYIEKDWTVTVLSYSLSWDLEPVKNHGTAEAWTIRFFPRGSSDGTKTIKWAIDNNEPTSITDSEFSMGGQKTISINRLTHGRHIIRAYMEVVVGSLSTVTPTLTHVGVWIDPENGSSYNPIIITDSEEITTTQYSTVPIRYLVVAPTDSVSIDLIENGQVITAIPSVPCSEDGSYPQIWHYVASTVGDNITLKIQLHDNNAIYASVTVSCTAIAEGEISPITDGIRFDLNPGNYSNSSDLSLVWDNIGNDGYNFRFSGEDLWCSQNFDWENGGFKQDDEGVTAFVVRRGCKVKLKRGLFDTVIDGTGSINSGTYSRAGEEFKIIFKITNCSDYDAVALRCTAVDNNGDPDMSRPGIIIGAQQASLSSGSQVVDIPYCEESKIELDVNIEGTMKDANDVPLGRSMALVWLKGVPSRAITYTSETWDNSTGEVIIGSDYCDIWIYRIKAYNSALSKVSIINNYIADCGNTSEMLARYARNEFYLSSNGASINLNDLVAANPDLRVIRIYAERMTKGKKDEVECGVELYYGRLFGTTPCFTSGFTSKADHIALGEGKSPVMTVQGTTSAKYGNAAYNLDLNFAAAARNLNWLDSTSTPIQGGYAMSDDDIPVDYFNIKLNVASSENANNVVLAAEYNDYQPFKTDARDQNPLVRDTIRGYPCAIFITNVGDEEMSTGESQDGVDHSRKIASGETLFYGCGDMNNSKKNFTVFGQNETSYLYQCCVEILDNENSPCNFAAVTDPSAPKNSELYWDNCFEFRFPKSPKQRHRTAFNTMQEWVVSTNTNEDINYGPVGPTNDNLQEPYVITEIDEETGNEIEVARYTVDSKEYRIAKFKKELGDVFSIDSLLYHYLFTERHCMVDNRAKNTFFSLELDPNFDPENDLTQKTGAPGYRWNVCKDYDNDTAEGNDNNGGLSFRYGLEDTDSIGQNGKFVDIYSPSAVRAVFNAAFSVLWTNLRDYFADELQAMYLALESEGAWNVNRILTRFDNYQSARPEALVAEDMYGKYLQPYINYNDAEYVSMLLGNKTDQRKQFETYQGVYMRSKYIDQQGVSTDNNNTLSFRLSRPSGFATAPLRMSIRPYADCYMNVAFEGVMEKRRVYKDPPSGETANQIFEKVSSGVSGQYPAYCYPAVYVSALEQIAETYPSRLTIDNAIRLRSFDAGSDSSTYSNPNTPASFEGFKNKLLNEINIKGWSGFNQKLDLSLQTSLRRLVCAGTNVSEITFANYAPVEDAILNPPTMLVARNLTALRDGVTGGNTGLVMSASKLQRLYVKNTTGVKRWLNYAIEAMNSGSLTGCHIDGLTYDHNAQPSITPESLIQLLSGGYSDVNDGGGAVTGGANNGIYLKGECLLDNATEDQKTTINNLISIMTNNHTGSQTPPLLTVQYSGSGNVAEYTVTFKDHDVVIDVQKVRSGSSAIDPRNNYSRQDENGNPIGNGAWVAEDLRGMYYTERMVGWDRGSLSNITSNTIIQSQYSHDPNDYEVRFHPYGRSDIFNTQIATAYQINGVWHGGSIRYAGANVDVTEDIKTAIRANLTTNGYFANYTSDERDVVVNNIIWAGWTKNNDSISDMCSSDFYDNIVDDQLGVNGVDLYPFFLVPQKPNLPSTGSTKTYLYSEDTRDASDSKYLSLSQLYYALLNPSTFFSDDANTQVYSKIVLRDEIKIRMLGGVIDEDYLTFELAGCGNYYQRSDSADYAKWVFLLKTPLSNAMYMNPTTDVMNSNGEFVRRGGTNAGGWADSWLRVELNTHIFEAIPQHWRALIKRVKVRSNIGMDGDHEVLYNTNEEVPSNLASEQQHPYLTLGGTTTETLQNIAYSLGYVKTGANGSEEGDIEKLYKTSDDYLFLLSLIDVGYPFETTHLKYTLPIYLGEYVGDSQSAYYISPSDLESMNASNANERTFNSLPIFPNGLSTTSGITSNLLRYDKNGAAVCWWFRSPFCGLRNTYPATHRAESFAGASTNSTYDYVLHRGARADSGMIGHTSGGSYTEAMYVIFAFCI